LPFKDKQRRRDYMREYMREYRRLQAEAMRFFREYCSQKKPAKRRKVKK